MLGIWLSCGLSGGRRTVWGGTIRSDVSDQLYLDLAADDDFNSVGYVSWRQSGSIYSGTGVLISDDWVLTAAHVVEGTDLLGAGISGMTVRFGGVRYNADQWIASPGWIEHDGNLDTGNDIGLIHLTRTPTDIEPSELYTGTSERGKIATIVGYGNTGTGTTGYEDNTVGTLRAGQNTIDSVQRNSFDGVAILSVDFDSPGRRGDSSLGSRTPLDLEYLAAPGDSGGPVYIDVDGTKLVAGIVSYISAFDGEIDSDYGDQASFTRVSSFIDWIESVTGPLDPPLLGDFNADGILTVEDLDSLTLAVIAPTIDLTYDVDGDLNLTDADRLYWVESLFGTIVGDSNLDGKFDSGDMVQVFQAGQYEDGLLANSTWATGDWNGDREFDTRDFIFALQHSPFDTSSGAATLATARTVAHSAQVPEPSGLVIFLSALALSLDFRRERTGSSPSRRWRQLH
ncbi:MAG: trypsin-like serine protease, partial [Planctomycetales bacterium]|nr:trypsin-like serine protease [Planctomycetales bacterium]